MGRWLHRWRHPSRCYAICAVARSGSNLLCDGLHATGRAGKPLQFFCEKLEEKYGQRYGLDPGHDYAGYVRGIVQGAATRNNIFGVRLMGWDLEKFLMRLRQTGAFGTPDGSQLQILQAAFPRLQFIQIRRRDRLRQAISKARALQTGLWRIAADKSAVAEAKFDPELISQSLQAARREEEIWSAFFTRNGIEPFLVHYEDLVSQYARSMAAVLKFLRIRLARGFEMGEPITVRQSDATSQEWGPLSCLGRGAERSPNVCITRTKKSSRSTSPRKCRGRSGRSSPIHGTWTYDLVA